MIYSQIELERMTLRQLKTAKDSFYRKYKFVDIAGMPGELEYLIRLKAEIKLRKL